MEKVISFAAPSKSQGKSVPSSEQANKGFYSQEERSAAKHRNQKAKTFGDTEDESEGSSQQQQGKAKIKPSKFSKGGKGADDRSAMQIETGPLKFVNRPNLGLASDGEGKVVQAIERRQNAIDSHPFIHLIFSPMKRVSVFKKHLAMMFRGLTYSLKFLKGPSDKFIKSKEVILVKPKDSKGRALVLDLDETLIHSCGPREKCQFTVKAETGQTIGLNVRPHCIQFLEQMSDLFDIHIFTASTIGYAQPIINFLNTNKHTINTILPRTACMQTKNGFFIKDLRIISNYDLKDIVIVDNLVHSFGLQVDNGIPIVEYHDDPKDQELLYLTDYLKELVNAADFREYNRSKLRLRDMIEKDYEFWVKDL